MGEISLSGHLFLFKIETIFINKIIHNPLQTVQDQNIQDDLLHFSIGNQPS
jgi:hypothetical protein